MATNNSLCFATGTPNEQICVTKSPTTNNLVVGNSLQSTITAPTTSLATMIAALRANPSRANIKASAPVINNILQSS
jgi:hypothetical protein